MQSIKAIIIEDEQPARELVKYFLREHSQIEVLSECANGLDGLKAIHDLKPDIVFLDVQLPKITGFEMLELLDQPPVIIFTTAFDQYAIKAFESNAVDYLLKPFSQQRFNEAILKAIERLHHKKNEHEKLSQLSKDTKNISAVLDRVVVKVGTRIEIIPSDLIIYIEAQDDYVKIFTDKGGFLKQNTMSYFEEHLSPSHFVRLHRSYIANVNQILRIEMYEKNGHIAILKNGNRLPISRTGYTKLKEILNF